jgi:hypothetical protein
MLKKDLSNAKKLARTRLSALELAKELDNVAVACRRSGITCIFHKLICF